MEEELDEADRQMREEREREEDEEQEKPSRTRRRASAKAKASSSKADGGGKGEGDETHIRKKRKDSKEDTKRKKDQEPQGEVEETKTEDDGSKAPEKRDKSKRKKDDTKEEGANEEEDAGTTGTKRRKDEVRVRGKTSRQYPFFWILFEIEYFDSISNFHHKTWFLKGPKFGKKIVLGNNIYYLYWNQTVPDPFIPVIWRIRRPMQTSLGSTSRRPPFQFVCRPPDPPAFFCHGRKAGRSTWRSCAHSLQMMRINISCPAKTNWPKGSGHSLALMGLGVYTWSVIVCKLRNQGHGPNIDLTWRMWMNHYLVWQSPSPPCQDLGDAYFSCVIKAPRGTETQISIDLRLFLPKAHWGFILLAWSKPRVAGNSEPALWYIFSGQKTKYKLYKIKVKVELIDQVEKYKTPGLTVTWKVNGGIEKALSPQREFLLCKCLILRISFIKGSCLRRTGPRTRIGFFDRLSTFSTSTTIFPSSQSPKWCLTKVDAGTVPCSLGRLQIFSKQYWRMTWKVIAELGYKRCSLRRNDNYMADSQTWQTKSNKIPSYGFELNHVEPLVCCFLTANLPCVVHDYQFGEHEQNLLFMNFWFSNWLWRFGQKTSFFSLHLAR